MTMDRLKNTGEAVIIDAGEGRDIHRDKQTVAKRLARWALAKDYGVDIIHQSPRYKSMEIKGNKVAITFDHVGAGLDSFDVRDPKVLPYADRTKNLFGPMLALSAKTSGSLG